MEVERLLDERDNHIGNRIKLSKEAARVDDLDELLRDGLQRLRRFALSPPSVGGDSYPPLD